MSRPAPLSGFPEWLPEGRIVEQRLIDSLRRTFELNGFAPVETRAVEPLSELLRKGETSKEVYVLRRLQETAPAPGQGELEERTLGLHFDLTVPFARYVTENAGHLEFPFKRYQIQKVWRGERPQQGRFREFVQADIDVVGAQELPFHYEVELPLVILEALNTLPIGRVEVLANNRKLAEGFYRGLGVGSRADAGEEAVAATFRALDKLAKIGPEATGQLLRDQAGLTRGQAAACLELAAITSGDADDLASRVTELAERHSIRQPLVDEGLAELGALLTAVAAAHPGQVRADLSIARGLDYYTGSVYETVLAGHADLGSICSGGRYDSLATAAGRTYPGVGLSVGLTRLVSLLLGQGLVKATRATPTCVLVAVVDEGRRAESVAIAAKLRRRGIPTDVAPEAAKFGRQIKHADRRGIPYVWFPGVDGAFDQVKDIRTGEQSQAVASAWNPPFEDLWPRVVAPEPPGVADSVDTSIRLPDRVPTVDRAATVE